MFLAFVQWRVLEQWMGSKGFGTFAKKLAAESSTIKSMEVIIPVKHGDTSADLTVRTVARPQRRVAELVTRPELPTRNRILGDVRAEIPTTSLA